MSRRPFWIGAMTLVLVLGPAAGAWGGRPLDTEDTGTTEPGKADLELSGDYARNPEDNSWSVKGVLSVGLRPRLEARIESALLLLEPEDQRSRAGIADSLFGVKYRLLDESDAFPAMLAGFTVRLPTGAERRGLGAADVDAGIVAVASKAVGPLTLTGNVGYTFVTRDRELDFWTLAASLDYRVAKAWILVGEVVSAVGADRAADVAVLRAGAIYAVSDRLKFDGAVGVGLTRGSPDVLITIGMTISLFERGGESTRAGLIQGLPRSQGSW